MTRPSPALVEDMSGFSGDLAILGVGGKMGPTLARLAFNALREAGSGGRVYAVARFSEPGLEAKLRGWGLETIRCDLMDRAALARLPDFARVVFMAGRKFGSTGNEPLTWAMNAHMPALVAERYREAAIVAFSTGNVYPFAPVTGPHPTEDTPPGPVGEYGQSCLGRERMFQHFSAGFGTPVTLIRLSYAIDLRYGVLLDVGGKVFAGEPIDLKMGHANVIWQGDANSYALRGFRIASSPPSILNVTGPEAIEVRQVASRFGELLGREPVFLGSPEPTALLCDASKCVELFGPPSVSVEQMIRWTAHWLRIGGRSLAKPTHYESRDGRF